MARTDRVCGAVTGAVMVLGLAYGGTGADDSSAKEATYAAVQEFLAAFASAHGSVACTDLLGYNLGDPAEAAAAREAGAVPRICPALVRSAGILLEETLTRRA
jgi:C_GCAxxG_C_C family probable redox protein